MMVISMRKAGRRRSWRILNRRLEHVGGDAEFIDIVRLSIEATTEAIWHHATD